MTRTTMRYDGKKRMDGQSFITEEGNSIAVCMRDGTFELTVPGSDRHFKVDIETGDFVEM